jgi:hypothetical protein
LRAISPPSTGITAPVRHDAAGRHGLSVICATSSPEGVETALATALERRVQVLLAGGMYVVLKIQVIAEFCLRHPHG